MSEKENEVEITSEILLQVNSFTGTPIIDRDFDWYYGAAFRNELSNAKMEIYDNIFNSDTPLVNNEGYHTRGFNSVNDHLNKWGIRSEEAEYMFELAELDTHILKYLLDNNLIKEGSNDE